jgi:hypothetical protein
MWTFDRTTFSATVFWPVFGAAVWLVVVVMALPLFGYSVLPAPSATYLLAVLSLLVLCACATGLALRPEPRTLSRASEPLPTPHLRVFRSWLVRQLPLTSIALMAVVAMGAARSEGRWDGKHLVVIVHAAGLDDNARFRQALYARVLTRATSSAWTGAVPSFMSANPAGATLFRPSPPDLMLQGWGCIELPSRSGAVAPITLQVDVGGVAVVRVVPLPAPPQSLMSPKGHNANADAPYAERSLLSDPTELLGSGWAPSDRFNFCTPGTTASEGSVDLTLPIARRELRATLGAGEREMRALSLDSGAADLIADPATPFTAVQALAVHEWIRAERAQLGARGAYVLPVISNSVWDAWARAAHLFTRYNAYGETGRSNGVSAILLALALLCGSTAAAVCAQPRN